jgi:hypothetical protein
MERRDLLKSIILVATGLALGRVSSPLTELGEDQSSRANRPSNVLRALKHASKYAKRRMSLTAIEGEIPRSLAYWFSDSYCRSSDVKRFMCVATTRYHGQSGISFHLSRRTDFFLAVVTQTQQCNRLVRCWHCLSASTSFVSPLIGIVQQCLHFSETASTSPARR